MGGTLRVSRADANALAAELGEPFHGALPADSALVDLRNVHLSPRLGASARAFAARFERQGSAVEAYVRRLGGALGRVCGELLAADAELARVVGGVAG